MNKQIVEFDTQAKDYAAMELAESGQGGIPRFNQLYRDKFAELIVKECITRMMRVGGDESFYSNYVMTYLDCIEDIKQHFGVK